MAVENKGVARANSFEGQKSGLPIESYSLESGSEIKNFVLKEGALQRVAGGETYAEVLPTESGGVASLHRFKNLWIAQRGTAIACEDSEGSATFTTIMSGLSSSAKMFSAAWRDRIFFVNGTDLKFLFNNASDSLSTDQYAADIGFRVGYGITGFTFPAPSVAGNVPNGEYSYIVTLVDSRTNSESPGIGSLQGADGLTEISPNSGLGPSKTVATVSGGAKKVETLGLTTFLQSAKSRNPRATHFCFYRATITGGVTGTFYLVPYNNTNNYYNSIDDFVSSGDEFIDNSASTTTISLPENNQSPPSIEEAERLYDYCIYRGVIAGIPVITETSFNSSGSSGFRSVRFFRDQLFGIGAKCAGLDFTSYGATVVSTTSVISVPGRQFNFDSILHGSEVYQPDYWPYIWEVGRGDGQDAIGLGVLGDTALLAFKEKSTYYLSGSSPDNYILRIMDTNVGCVHQSTIQETPKGVICLDRAGFFLFDKIGLGRKISRQIQDIIDDIDFTKSANFYSWYDPKDQRYYCAVAQSPYTYPNLTLCLDLDSEEWTFLQGAEGASRMADTSSQGEFVDLQGSSTNGRLIDLSDPSIVTFNGQVVESIWTSGPVTFGNEQYQKRLRWLYLRVKCAGSWTVRIEIIPDYNEMKKYTIESYNIGTSNATWYSDVAANDGTLLWDEGAWAYAGLRRDVVKIPVLGKGRSFQVRIINRDTNALAHSFTIENISLEAKGLDK